MKDIHSASADRLFQGILTLKTVEECYALFEDLCTMKEIEDMAQRLDTAILLEKGDSYMSIAEEVGVSTATISRVSRCLNYGTGGYRRVINALKAAEDVRESSDGTKE